MHQSWQHGWWWGRRAAWGVVSYPAGPVSSPSSSSCWAADAGGMGLQEEEGPQDIPHPVCLSIIHPPLPPPPLHHMALCIYPFSQLTALFHPQIQKNKKLHEFCCVMNNNSSTSWTEVHLKQRNKERLSMLQSEENIQKVKTASA